MRIRTTQSTVTFEHPFKLSALDGAQPAGTYRLEVDEEEIADISFVAYRRTATMLHTPSISTAGGLGQVFTIDPQELAQALQADGRASDKRSGASSSA